MEQVTHARAGMTRSKLRRLVEVAGEPIPAARERERAEGFGQHTSIAIARHDAASLFPLAASAAITPACVVLR